MSRADAASGMAGRVFYNGGIITMDAALSRVSALGVRGCDICYAGNSLEAAKAAAGPGCELVDLHGRAVVPGLFEGHMHFMQEGRRLEQLDLFGKSKEEILVMVRRKAAETKPGAWIAGLGWNNETWPDKHWPCKEDLDACAPLNPVALTRADTHSVWANSPALAAAGFDRDSPDMPGGEIMRAPCGDLLGILVDTPMQRLWAAMPQLNDAQKRTASLRVQEELFGFGITSVSDAWQMPQDHEFFKSLYAEGALKIRLNGMLSYYALAGENTCAPVRGLYGERLSLAACKLVCDGSLGSRSAWLGSDYADRPGHHGNSRHSDAELYGLMRLARQKGFQVCAHAIGDAAVHQALEAMRGVLEEGSAPEANLPDNSLPRPGLPERNLPDHRWRIEHFQTARPGDLALAMRLGVIPAMQTIHQQADQAMAERRLRPETLAISYPWRGVIDNGGIIVNGSDSPVETANPFKGMHAAITRDACAGRGRIISGLTRLEALKSYTVWPAYAEFAERRKGSLETGKLADFAVLDRDILACPAEDLPHTRVTATVLGGETVYEMPE